MLAEPAAARLTQGAPGEKQGETDADGRFTAALGMDEERQEKKVAHARRGVERADREEQIETAAVSSPSDRCFVVSEPRLPLSCHASFGCTSSGWAHLTT